MAIEGLLNMRVALRAAVGNTRPCVAMPYWASEVLRAVMRKRLCCVCWKATREANGRRLARPIQSTRAWPLLACGCHEHGALWSCKRFVRHACATWMESQGSSRSPGSGLTRPLELPSGATLCPDEADVALARATGL